MSFVLRTSMQHDLPLPDGAEVEERMIQELERAALLIGERTKRIWTQSALALGLRGGGPGSYVHGIQVEGRVEIVERRRLEDMIRIVLEVANTAPHALYVDQGRSAFHLPTAIDWSKRTGSIKIGKNGKPYLHIPFRHRTPASGGGLVAQGSTRATRGAMMPDHVYQQARRLQATHRMNVGPVYTVRRAGGTRMGTIEGGKAGGRTTTERAEHAANAHGATVRFRQADRYTWGDRLSMGEQGERSGPMRSRSGSWRVRAGYQGYRGPTTVLGAGPRGGRRVNPAWGSSKYEGMFRTEHQGSKGVRSSEYMTIRTITPDSRGWNIPAMHGKHIVDRVGTVMAQDEQSATLIATAVAAAIGQEAT